MANTNTSTDKGDKGKSEGKPAGAAAGRAQAEVVKQTAVAGFQMPGGATQVQSAHRYYWFPFLRADGEAQAISIQDIEKGKPNPCHCEVLTRTERHDSTDEKPGWFYLVKLIQPCMAVDRDKKIHTMKKGDVIVVDERVQLRGLEGFIKGPNVIECVIVPAGKIKGGKETVAMFDLHAIPTERKFVALPSAAKAELPPAPDGDGGGDVPFS